MYVQPSLQGPTSRSFGLLQGLRRPVQRRHVRHHEDGCVFLPLDVCACACCSYVSSHRSAFWAPDRCAVGGVHPRLAGPCARVLCCLGRSVLIACRRVCRSRSTRPFFQRARRVPSWMCWRARRYGRTGKRVCTSLRPHADRVSCVLCFRLNYLVSALQQPRVTGTGTYVRG